jgi:hypothetical protein
MDPNIWGPSGWLFLHTITLMYPENPNPIEQKQYYDLFHSLQYTLPCPSCREHYSESLKKFPIKLNTREELVEWLVMIHNQVNISDGKPEWTLDQFYRHYKKLYTQGNSCVVKLFIIFLLFCIIFYILMYYRS